MSEFDDMKGGDDEDGGQVAYDQDDDRSESDFSDSEDDMGDSDTVRPCDLGAVCWWHYAPWGG